MPNLNSSFASLAKVIGGDGYQQAFDQQSQSLGKMGLMQSQMRQNDADIGYKNAQAAKIKQESDHAAAQFALLQDPEFANNMIRQMGLDPSDPVQARRAKELTGLINITRAVGKQSDFKNLAEGMGITQNIAQTGVAPEIAKTDPTQAAWLANAGANKGAPELFNALPGGMGTVQRYTGALAYDPGLYNSKLEMDRANVNRDNAAAGASRASATNSYASAAYTSTRNAQAKEESTKGTNQIVWTEQGPFTFNNKTREVAPLNAPNGQQLTKAQPGGKPGPDAQKVADAKDVLGLLDLAGPLLEKSTSSGVGSMVDVGLNFFGVPTTGSEAAAQLRTIEGMLISKMPKMSGPQSDKDVLLYKQMAGQIGDATKPIGVRRAAMETIRQINERYANPQSGGASGSWGAPASTPSVDDLLKKYGG